MISFDLLETITLAMHSEFKELESQLTDLPNKSLIYFGILNRIDPFNLRIYFKFTITLYLYVLIMHVAFGKSYNDDFFYRISASIKAISLIQAILACGSLFICVFQTFGRFVEPRDYVMLYYSFDFFEDVVIIIVELAVFYWMLPFVFVPVVRPSDHADFSSLCGCGECNTQQQPLTNDLLETYKILQMRFENDDPNETKRCEISIVKQRIYNPDTCSICLEDFKNGFQEKETHVLTCGHMFHKPCIHKWLLEKYDGAKVVDMSGIFEKIKNETNMEAMHGMMYASHCPVCYDRYVFILCKVQENKKQ
jgi:hypothetical protein